MVWTYDFTCLKYIEFWKNKTKIYGLIHVNTKDGCYPAPATKHQKRWLKSTAEAGTVFDWLISCPYNLIIWLVILHIGAFAKITSRKILICLMLEIYWSIKQLKDSFTKYWIKQGKSFNLQFFFSIICLFVQFTITDVTGCLYAYICIHLQYIEFALSDNILKMCWKISQLGSKTFFCFSGHLFLSRQPV